MEIPMLTVCHALDIREPSADLGISLGLRNYRIGYMSHELQIFLSHKKGDSERNARHIAGDLALFGGPNVKVICSANFEPGENWEQKIRQGLGNSNWLVLLYTGPHTEWDWCLFETGFFRALMEEQAQRRLICLHDPEICAR